MRPTRQLSPAWLSARVGVREGARRELDEMRDGRVERPSPLRRRSAPPLNDGSAACWAARSSAPASNSAVTPSASLVELVQCPNGDGGLAQGFDRRRRRCGLPAASRAARSLRAGHEAVGFNAEEPRPHRGAVIARQCAPSGAPASCVPRHPFLVTGSRGHGTARRLRFGRDASRRPFPADRDGAAPAAAIEAGDAEISATAIPRFIATRDDRTDPAGCGKRSSRCRAGLPGSSAAGAVVRRRTRRAVVGDVGPARRRRSRRDQGRLRCRRTRRAVARHRGCSSLDRLPDTTRHDRGPRERGEHPVDPARREGMRLVERIERMRREMWHGVTDHPRGIRRARD